LRRDYAWDVLVAAGADIDERDTGGGTALMAIAKHGTPSHKIERILQLGADVNARDFNGRTAVMIAAMYGQIGVLQRLLTNGADVKAIDYTGRTALSYCEATALKDSDVTTMLLPGDARSERLQTKSNPGLQEAAVERSLVHARDEAAQLLRAATL
jgi:ankyrin repeat protein